MRLEAAEGNAIIRWLVTNSLLGVLLEQLWEARRAAERALRESLRDYSELFECVFRQLHAAALRLAGQDTTFGRVCALAVIKSANLAQGCYSLSLDGLAQESGALFRPLIEALEMLRYLRESPVHINEAIEGRLPLAGEISRSINGKFQFLRNWLNAHASHLSLNPAATAHLIDFSKSEIRVIQPFNERVLQQNLRILLAVLSSLNLEAASCIAYTKAEAADVADIAEQTHKRSFQLIDRCLT